MTAILRVQDSSGRGPWRPGISKLWEDASRTDFDLPAIYQELPPFTQIVGKAHRNGLHIGCAARSGLIFDRWFSAKELAALAAIGFAIHDASGCEVLAETETQVLIGSPNPLMFLPRYGRVEVAA
jgi:hypothetical protein